MIMHRHKDDYEDYIIILESNGIKDARAKIENMYILDFLIMNEDRHLNNFGIIRDVNTLKWIKCAPIFDNGCSLWFDENDMYVGEFFLTKPFEEYEKKQLNLIKNIDWFDIEKLDGFTFEVKEILLSMTQKKE